MSEYIDLIPIIVEREGAIMPEGFDSWGIKSVQPDLRTTHDFKWPFPGSVAEASGPFFVHNKSGCPTSVGDGLCVAKSWGGMGSGGICAQTMLLVAYAESDVLGSESAGDEIRCRRVAVVALVDGCRLLRERGAGANLRGADLYGADLYGADLRGANLRGANLRGASLYGASLYGANLRGANLRGANLYGANLRGANLYEADLYGANLRGANLRGANLRGASLYEANLRGASLYEANLYGARADSLTAWPQGFDVAASGAVVVVVA